MRTSVEGLKQRIRDRLEAVQRILGSPDGRLLVEALEAEFWDGDLLGDDDREMHFNLGAREVVRYLRELRDAAERIGGTNVGK